MRSRVYETVERPSVCLSVHTIIRPLNDVAAVGQAVRFPSIATWPALSSKCKQCHFVVDAGS